MEGLMAFVVFVVFVVLIEGRGADLFYFFETDAVSEHAFALAAALTRRVLPMHQMTVEGEKWAQVRPPVMFGKPPRVNSEETLVSF
jgi:hypothetical protein